MTPQKEADMRAQLADYSKAEFIELAIRLQDVIDDHVTEKRGMQSAIDNMNQRLPILEQKLEEYEEGPPVDSDEVEQLRGENDALRKKLDEIRERFDKVQALNEKFQEKLLDSV